MTQMSKPVPSHIMLLELLEAEATTHEDMVAAVNVEVGE